MRKHIFTVDGALIISSHKHDTAYGTYNVENDSLILNYIWANDKSSERYKIIECNSNKMVLEQSFKDLRTLKTFWHKVQKEKGIKLPSTTNIRY